VRVRESGRSDAAADGHGNLYEHLERWMEVGEVRRIRSQYVEQGEGRAGGDPLDGVLPGTDGTQS
jgi:hypothetical protein